MSDEHEHRRCAQCWPRCCMCGECKHTWQFDDYDDGIRYCSVCGYVDDSGAF